MTESLPMTQNAQDLIGLAPGDVALILQAGEEGGFLIAHNIDSITKSNTLDGANGDAAGVMLALAFADIMEHDEPAMTAALIRVAAKLQGNTLRAVAV